MSKNIFVIKKIDFKNYYRLSLNNKDSFILGIVNDNICKKVKVNDIVEIKGNILKNNIIKVTHITKLQNISLDMAVYIYSPIFSLKEKYETFCNIILSVKDIEIKNLLKELFLNIELMKRFLHYPASKKSENHHSEKFGLFLHTLEVIFHCIHFARIYNLGKKSEDYLIAASLFHDIGKCADKIYLLNGHKIASLEILNECANRAQISHNTKMLLSNIILHTHRQDYDFKENIYGKILKIADTSSASLNFYLTKQKKAA